MPLDIFLKLDGIEGESTARGHEKEIVVLSYEQGIDTPIIQQGGGGGGAGRPTFSGVRLRKAVDAASIPLLLACASGTHIKDARFTFQRPGQTPFDFYKVSLEDVLVTRVSQRAGTGPQYPLSFEELDAGADSVGFLDDVTLEYGRIRWEYQTVGPDGRPGAPVTGGWDRRANTKI